ncbi:putative lysozyme [Pseudomonas phage Bf7]|uniref:Endolysin n=1 Tax=Pseudomonas phage Bf7 TaxID=1100790 RepID=H2ELT8_9CAUD|nr:endolysin [Pseudomonas phage Bf7]AEX65840.1 putative lysozyme [Pseudomonas phage Bf7]
MPKFPQVGRLARSAVAVLSISAAGLGFIQHEEGTVNRAYLDSIGKPTICTGHTGPEVRLGLVYSDAQCAELLRTDANSAAAAVKRTIKVPLYQYEFDALVSFCFNVGNTNCTTSTMFKLINQGRYDEAGPQLLRWRYAGGKDCSVRANNCYGVYTRRHNEYALWQGQY